jgi:Nucleotidyl transferase AbiEii toxin, Type IV TA system
MSPAALTPLQVQATRLFFSLPESSGFAVADGAALLAQGLIHRPTRDVDLFLLEATATGIATVAASFEAAIKKSGWTHRRVIDQHDFIRLEITGNRESLIIDLGRDSPAEEPVDTTDLGPTLSPRDLAARKTLALFGRAEARDFSDVYELARRYGREHLLAWAAADDPDSTSTYSPACLPPSNGSPTRTCQ